MRQHELFEARPVLRIQHVRAFPLVISTHGQKPPEGAFYSSSLLDVTNKTKWLVSGPTGNNWRSRMVCTKRNTSHMRRGLPGLSLWPAPPSQKIAGKKRLNLAPIVLTLVASFSSSRTPNSPRQVESRTMRPPQGMRRSGGVAVFAGFYLLLAAGRNLLAESSASSATNSRKATVLLVGGWFFSFEWPPMPVVR